MLNLLLYGLILVFSTTLFEFTYCYSGISRSFTALGKGIAENSIVVKDENGEKPQVPYYDETLFVRLTDEYFATALQRFLPLGDKPEINYVFSVSGVILPKGRHNLCTLSFSCPVYKLIDYRNQANFLIRKGEGHA